MKNNFKTLQVTEKNSFLFVELHQPDIKNAMNLQMIQDLTDLFQQSHSKPYRGLFLSGSGSVFCSGADLNWMKNQVANTLEQNKKESEKLFHMFETLFQIPFPVITFVQGGAFGGALGLLAVSDFVVATAGAQFAFSEVRLGISPAIISYFVLQKLSMSKVYPYMSLALPFQSTHALQMGLVQQVVDDETKAMEVFSDWEKKLKALSPTAFRETKKLLLTGAYNQKNNVIDLISNLRISAEGQEGLKSFLEKRKPQWSSN